MPPENELLRQYLENGSETAFAELVRRHVAWVYSMALRLVGRDRQLAEDVAQVVFMRLAQRGYQLTGHPTLAGWLHTTTYYAATNLVRAEARRRMREQEAFIMQDHNATPEPDWDKLRPVLDEAIKGLKRPDQEAILLRFFQKKSHREVGAALGLNEQTARKRSERALEQLRDYFARRGINASAALLVGLLSANAVEAAPDSLAAGIARQALAAGSQTGWMEAGMKFLYMNTKTKIMAGVVIVLLLALWLKLDFSPETVSPLGDAKATGSAAARARPPVVMIEKLTPAVSLEGSPGTVTGTKTETSPGVMEYSFKLDNKKFSFFLIQGSNAVPLKYDDLRRDPAFVAAFAKQLKDGFMGLSRRLGDLPGQFGVTAEQADYLVNVEAERQAQVALLDLQYFGANLSPADLADFAKQKQAIGQAAETALQQVFPVDQTRAAYQTYVAQTTERNDVQALQGALAGANVTVSPEQSQALVNLMSGEEQKADFPGPLQQAVTGLTGGDTMVNRQQLASVRTDVLQNAAAIFSPAQMQVVQDNQDLLFRSSQQQNSAYMQALVATPTSAGDGLIVGSGGGNQTVDVVKSADSLSVNTSATTEVGTASVKMDQGKSGSGFSFTPARTGLVPGSETRGSGGALENLAGSGSGGPTTFLPDAVAP